MASTTTSVPPERPVSPPPATCKVVLAGGIASKLMAEVKADLAKLGRKPLLVGFLANSDPAAKMYADWTGKTCEEKCASRSLLALPC
jgi:methylenetetrahydrofolate dehydrogenase (NAD+)